MSHLYSIPEISHRTGIPEYTVRRIASRLSLGQKVGWSIVLTEKDAQQIEEYHKNVRNQQSTQTAIAA